jgi:hypothetical protein
MLKNLCQRQTLDTMPSGCKSIGQMSFSQQEMEMSVGKNITTSNVAMNGKEATINRALDGSMYPG